MPYHTNLRRAFPTWERAIEVANAYGMQTGVKHRIYRQRDVWRVAATDKPALRMTARRRAPGRLPGASARKQRGWIDGEER